MKYLKLRLSGVLQYYSSKQSTTLRQTYTTDFYPTKQAVIGLICSALGVERTDTETQRNLYNSLSMKYKSLNDNTTVLTDFQTVKPLKSQSAYMNKMYTRNKFNRVSGGYAADQNIIKNVQYLQDADFEVYVGGDEETLKTIYSAIQNPKYALYLGKRSCVPNKPIVTSFKLFTEEDLENVYDCP